MRQHSRPAPPLLLLFVWIVVPAVVSAVVRQKPDLLIWATENQTASSDDESSNEDKPLKPNETYVDITSGEKNPIFREMEIRDILEQKMLNEELTDWRTIEPHFEDGHLVRIRVIRDGELWTARVLVMLPIDQFNQFRLWTLRAIEATPFCNSSRTQFVDHGKDTDVYMLTYKCRLFTSA